MMTERKCGHVDVVQNRLQFVIPVYETPSPEDTFVLDTPTRYIKRDYCMECAIAVLDKALAPRPWWKFW